MASLTYGWEMYTIVNGNFPSVSGCLTIDRITPYGYVYSGVIIWRYFGAVLNPKIES